MKITAEEIQKRVDAAVRRGFTPFEVLAWGDSWTDHSGAECVPVTVGARDRDGKPVIERYVNSAFIRAHRELFDCGYNNVLVASPSEGSDPHIFLRWSEASAAASDEWLDVAIRRCE